MTKFLFHVVANKQCVNPKWYIWYTHLHVTTVGQADYFHSNFFLTDTIWEFCDVSNIVFHPGVFSSMALESSQLLNIAYQFVLNSNTDLLWICFVVATVYWFVRRYEVCDCFWRILSMGSWYYYYFTPTSPILWPVYVFEFIITVLLLLLCTYRTKVFLFLPFYISSLQLSEGCLIYGSLLHVQATVFFLSYKKQPTVFLLYYVSCLQFSNCCCSRTFIFYNHLTAFAYFAILPCMFIFTVLQLDYPRLHYRCTY